jgi:hypothetical protein
MRALAWGIVLLSMSVTGAASLDYRGRLFGHEVVVAKKGFDDQLSVDGLALLKESVLAVSEVAMVAGVGIAIGSSATGGNMCSPAPFVISFPKGEPPRLDGPLDACRPVSHQVHEGDILFARRASPSYEGQRWTWTLDRGFQEAGSTRHTPDPARGWAALRSRHVDHPLGLFDYGEIASRMKALVGSDEKAFAAILGGPGSGEFRGDLFVGKACMAHNCDRTASLVVADIRSRQVFLAWKAEGQPIVVRPAVPEWNSAARQELRSWAQPWK